MKNDYKLYLTIACISLVLISIVGGQIFANKETYNPITKEVDIKDFLNNDVGKITLNTPLYYGVIPGKDRLVAEFSIENFKDSSDVFSQMEFFNKRFNDISIDRKFTYKKKVFLGKREIKHYISNCSDDLNVSICEEIKDKSTYEDVFTWDIIDPKQELKTGNITIGIFTDVYINDYVEWIPTFYKNVRVTEWATWGSSLNNELVGFWNHNEGTGTNLGDSYRGLYNGTLMNGLTWSDGILGNATGKYDKSGDWINFTDTQGLDDLDFGYLDSFTISTWINTTNIDTTEQVIVSNTLGDMGYMLALDDYSGDKVIFEFATDWDAGRLYTRSATVSILNTWTHIVVVYNGTYNASQVLIYVDGVSQGLTAEKDNLASSPTYTRPLKFGNRVNGGDVAQYFLDGHMDEVGIWNRSLTAIEISDLYNGGVGISYVGDANPPDVIINYPTNSTLSTDSIEFNITATDDTAVSNCYMSLDSALNNNTMVQEGVSWIYTNASISDGDYHAEFYCDDASLKFNMSESVDFRLEYPPLITINNPTNATSNLTTQHFNITVSDLAGIDACWMTLNNGVINYSMVANGTDYEFTNSSMIQGDSEVEFYCNDSNNYINNSESVSFFIDSVAPSVTFNLPNNYIMQKLQENAYVTASLMYWVTDGGVGIDTVIYNLTNVTSIDSNLSAGDTESLTYNLYDYTTYTLNVIANDTLGNINDSNLTFSVQLLGGGGGGFSTASIVEDTTEEIPQEKQGFNLMESYSRIFKGQLESVDLIVLLLTLVLFMGVFNTVRPKVYTVGGKKKHGK